MCCKRCSAAEDIYSKTLARFEAGEGCVVLGDCWLGGVEGGLTCCGVFKRWRRVDTKRRLFLLSGVRALKLGDG